MILEMHGKEIESVENPLMDEIFSRFTLMYEHYIEQDEIAHYFVAKGDKGGIIGFMGVGYCGRTVLIEVLDRFKGKGVGRSLVKYAVEQGCEKAWLPRQDGCDGFWVRMEAEFS